MGARPQARRYSSAIAIVAAYALALQTLLALAWSPLPAQAGLDRHALCAPDDGSRAPPDRDAAHACCVLGCTALAPALGPPPSTTLPLPRLLFGAVAARAVAPPPAPHRSPLPLGSRAPPVLA